MEKNRLIYSMAGTRIPDTAEKALEVMGVTEQELLAELEAEGKTFAARTYRNKPYLFTIQYKLATEAETEGGEPLAKSKAKPAQKHRPAKQAKANASEPVQDLTPETPAEQPQDLHAGPVAFKDAGEWFKVSEIARMLKVTSKTILNEIHRGEIDAVAIGKNWRISEAALTAYLERNRKQE